MPEFDSENKLLYRNRMIKSRLHYGQDQDLGIVILIQIYKHATRFY